jgi:hypothetical protein
MPASICAVTCECAVGIAGDHCRRYMMMRRYVDAIKCFTNILLFIARTKQYHTRSYQYDQILKKNEQMCVAPPQQSRFDRIELRRTLYISLFVGRRPLTLVLALGFGRYALLAICLSLCPYRIDENIHTTVRDKYTDKMARMQARRCLSCACTAAELWSAPVDPSAQHTADSFCRIARFSSYSATCDAFSGTAAGRGRAAIPIG